jgi:hypothetical protein
MATANPKIFLSRSRDIPFNKPVLSRANVRRVKAGISIEDLAEDIANRTLLQSLCVRPVCDADGAETDMFEVPARGRRYRALEKAELRQHLRQRDAGRDPRWRRRTVGHRRHVRSIGDLSPRILAVDCAKPCFRNRCLAGRAPQG